MKVILVNTNHFAGGGDSTYTFNLAELLRSKGIEVAFFAMQDSRNLPDPNDELFVSHIDFRELNRKKNPLTAIKVLKRSIYSLEAKKKFKKLLERFKPDIIHLQNIHHHITPSVIFEAKKYGIPVVWTLHDYKLICPNSHFLIDATGKICEDCGNNLYYRTIFNKCKKDSILASLMAGIEAYAHRLIGVRNQVDFFLTPSQFLRNRLLERNFNPEKVVHVPLFLPDNLFDYADNSEDYFLFLGKLEPIKGVYQLLDACKKIPEIRLVLAGRTEESIRNKLDKILPQNAKYVGLKQGNELRELLKNAYAVVLPSLWYENQPFCILEAFACGKPVIASNLGGTAELVKDKERGLLIPAGDAKALAEAMSWMFNHPEKAKQMGKNAYEYAEKEHRADIHYQKLMTIYRKVLN